MKAASVTTVLYVPRKGIYFCVLAARSFDSPVNNQIENVTKVDHKVDIRKSAKVGLTTGHGGEKPKTGIKTKSEN